MFSNGVSGPLDRIAAAIDVLMEVDLSALSADDLVRLAGRCEKLAVGRRCRVGISPSCGRARSVSSVVWPLKVLADWLRVSPSGGAPPC